MAQLSGAARSTSHVPVAFAAGTLLATAVIATGIILALALGVDVELRDGAAAAQPGALAPDAPISVPRVAPRPGVSTYDGRLDPIERDYIRGIQTGKGFHPRYVAEPPAPADPWQPHGELPRNQLVPR
jgi:hypothetical protein